MEKSTRIKQDEFEQGYFITLECFVCYNEEAVTAPTKKELSKELKERGWKVLDSDDMMTRGHYCGCKNL